MGGASRFDIVAAHYFHAAHNHSGQWSELYKKLCRIEEYFTPGPCCNGPEDISECCVEIYDQLTAKTSGR